MLRVVSMHPQPTLALARVQPDGAKLDPGPATILSPQLAQRTQQTLIGSISKLLIFMNLLGKTAIQTLPVKTQTLLLEIRKKTVNIKDLTSISRLRAALANSGLLLESKLGAQAGQSACSDIATNPDFKALLFQLFRSLHGKPPTPSTGMALSPYSMEDGDPRSINLIRQLMSDVEEALLSIVANQKRTLQESTDSRQCWFFQLPVNVETSQQSISLTLFRERNPRAELADAWQYGAEFSVELAGSGIISVQLVITDALVSVTAACDRLSTLQRLRENSAAFSAGLSNYGLTLDSFKCRLIDPGKH